MYSIYCKCVYGGSGTAEPLISTTSWYCRAGTVSDCVSLCSSGHSVLTLGTALVLYGRVSCEVVLGARYVFLRTESS